MVAFSINYEDRWIHRNGSPLEISRKQIIRKAIDFVDQRIGEYTSVRDLATAADVSERTLRTAFREYFGVGPVRFLKLRTLHQARHALKVSTRSLTTVTEIATRFGVWELGRFAHDYRGLFGEHPSETLRCAFRNSHPTIRERRREMNLI